MNSIQHPGFESLPLSPGLIQVTRELGYKAPTAVQAQSIPLLLQGKDVIAQSQTGSGKTAAFTLPILEKLNLKERRVQALVLCPTRELCAQVAREIRKLGRRHPGLQVLILSGGMPMFPQLASLEKGVHLVVGTPGRVLDHLGRGSLELGYAATVVLDEADRMLEMGFQEDMEQILSRTPENRQTVLFSATFPRTIEALSRHYQHNPSRVTVENPNQTVSSIRQLISEVDPAEKAAALLSALEEFRPQSVIVFCNFKASVVEVARELADAGISVDALHGDLEQNDRDRVMAKFRNQSIRILVATDVAARGIDVAKLDAVVNFELPAQPEIYVHRVGRTGRAGQTGLAISFYSSREKAKIQSIETYAAVRLEKIVLSKSPVSLPVEALMQTLYISGGRKEKVRPGDILGALTGEAGGLDAAKIGKIEIHDHFSYVAVSAEIAALVLERLRNGRIKGRKFRVEMVK